ncbi:hypothetical protein HRI_001747900 [Hibiscus trionum]|uniref:Uncharacterized protein n=1 Tax=Hibiscus trionum TaxID=183268 RepID=A0A9W7HPG9_HIBTR|nr:hypothetical protein HRI_001747900 [Hibiscus trionum]
MYPFIYAGDAPNATLGAASFSTKYCLPGSLNATIVRGKIVFCEYIIGWDSDGVMQAGVASTVCQDAENKDYQFSYPLPLSNVNMNDGRMLLNYLNTTEYFPSSFYKIGQDNNQFALFHFHLEVPILLQQIFSSPILQYRGWISWRHGLNLKQPLYQNH